MRQKAEDGENTDLQGRVDTDRQRAHILLGGEGALFWSMAFLVFVKHRFCIKKVSDFLQI